MNWQNLFLTILLFACSVSLYQAYIFVGTALCILLALRDLYGEEIEIKTIVKNFLYQGTAFVSGIILYLFSNRMFQNYLDVPANEDRGFSTMGVIPIKRMLYLLYETYLNFYDYYFSDALLNNSYWRKDIINSIFFFLFIILLVILFFQKKLYRSKLRAILIVVCMALIPLGFMGITVASKDYTIRNSVTGILMIPGMNMIYALPLAMVQEIKTDKLYRLIRGSTIFISCIMILVSVKFSEAFQNHMQYEKTRYVKIADLIADQIIDEYGPIHDRKILVVGVVKSGEINFPYQWWGRDSTLQYMVSAYGLVWTSKNGQIACWNSIFENYLGLSYEMCTVKEYEEVTASDQFRKIPVFPEKGSIMEYEDIIVVKLSNSM